MDIIIPKTQESDTGGGTAKGYEKFLYPEGLKPEDEIKIYRYILQRVINKEIELEKKVEDYKDKVDKYKSELDRQTSKNIEIIGIFSAVLALLIVDVSIIKSVDSFLSAILLIASLTCSMIIFAVLIHTLFSPADKVKFGKTFWVPITILGILIILGIISYFKNIHL